MKATTITESGWPHLRAEESGACVGVSAHSARLSATAPDDHVKADIPRPQGVWDCPNSRGSRRIFNRQPA